MLSSLWNETAFQHHNRTILVSATLAVITVALHLAILNSEWPGNRTAHSGIEIVAAVVGGVVGITLAYNSFVVDERWLRILGFGFIGVAALDLGHAVVSSRVAADALGNIDQLTLWTSLASRFALGAVVLCATLALVRRNDSGDQRALFPLSAWFFGIIVFAIAGSWLMFLFAGSLELSNSPETLLSLVSGSLFLGAFVLLAQRRSDLRNMYSAFAIFLLVNGLSEAAFKVFVAGPFDGYFAAAHVFKLFGYLVILIGILMESQRLYRFETNARQELGKVNESLNESNLMLTTARSDLQALTQIGRIAGASRTVADRFGEIGRIISSRIRADRIMVATVNYDRSECKIVAIFGQALPDREVGDMLPLMGTMIGDLLKSGQTELFNDSNIESTVRSDPRLAVDVEAGFRSWLSTPINAEDEVVGVLMVRSKLPSAYGHREAQFVEQVASQLAGPVRLRKSLSSGVA